MELNLDMLGEFDESAVKERFYDQVTTGPDCWIWTGRIINGYGRFKIQGKDHRIQHVAWMLSGRGIPMGYKIVPGCKTHMCVKLEHLMCVVIHKPKGSPTACY